MRRELLWKALLDPDVIKKILPGCDELVKVGENEYKATLNIQLGPVQGQFEGKFWLSDLNPPDSYHLGLSGKGTSGFLEGEGDIGLEDQDGTTSLNYEIDARIGGRIAAVGQRLLESSARAITRQGLQQFHEQIKMLYQDERAEDSSQTGETPSQTQFAANVAKGLLGDMIPTDRRPLFLGFSVVVLVVLSVVLFRACG